MMSDTKHTPGPWRYEWREYGGYDCMTSAYAVLDAKGHTLVAVDCGDYKQTANKHGKSPLAEVDARLIAAAPELLEAAKTAVGFGHESIARALKDELLKAIRKAEA